MNKNKKKGVSMSTRRQEKNLLQICGFVLLALTFSGCAIFNFGKTCLVKDGKPCADIVIAEKPPRMVKLAAEELQAYIEKISGAKLAITNAPGSDVPAHIYVGQSTYTDKLKISDDGLKHGAFKMLSGGNWFALVGHDADFVYPGPQRKDCSLEDRKRWLPEWDALTGETWENPSELTFKQYSSKLGVWDYDERGSLNAVYEFLRSLGVRWYMPGEIGEIVPKMTSLVLPKVDKTVHPDFALRQLGPYAPVLLGNDADAILWRFRLGLAPGDEITGLGCPAHGIAFVHGRDEVKKAHPEYFALFGGKRATDYGSTGYACLSSPGLFKANLKFIADYFKVYPGDPMINVMPNDAFIYLCQCDLCKGRSTPERGMEGMLSDYVWDYVNRVAKELYKTHPDKKVYCFAYNTYRLPPEKIDKFSPNVVVGICQSRSAFYDPETRLKAEALRLAWLKKLPTGSQLIIYDYYLHDGGMPVFYPHAISQDLRSLRGISMGENIEQSPGMYGFTHLNEYVTARLYWDAGQDVDLLLNEYYDKFYGTASKEMKAFFEYSETNWPKMYKDAAPIDKALELLASAQKAAGDTVYGKRIAMIADYCRPLIPLRDKLAKGRNKDLKFVVVPRGRPEVKLDGKLDDAFWKDLPEYQLYDVKTGQVPANGMKTSFRVTWCDDNAFYFGIRCEEPDIKGLNITARKPDETSVWEGDNIELMIETQGHSYYQIAISPAGAIMDVDRKGFNTLWTSGIEAATYVGDGFWSMELRVPAAGDMADTIDANNGISGRKPSVENPWYFNLCRQRMRGVVRELFTSSPLTDGSFHDLWNFGQLIVK